MPFFKQIWIPFVALVKLIV